MSPLRDHSHDMTVEAFLAFTRTRPDEERWELIDGEPVLSPSPSFGHQRVVGNLVAILSVLEDGVSWQVLPGIGVNVSETSLPVPDVMIRPATWVGGPSCDDMIAAFEVLSPSSVRRDLVRKRTAYANLAALQHYVILGQDRIHVRCFDRATGWAERRLTEADATLTLDRLGATLDLDRLYRGALP